MKTFSVTAFSRRIFKRPKKSQLSVRLWKRMVFSWQEAFKNLLPLGGVSEGNRISILKDGDTTLLAMKDAIDSAASRVWLEMYIFEPDKIGRFVRNALVEAALRGCEVILLYDHFGSPYIGGSFSEPLIKAGAKIIPFNPIWPWRKKGPWLYRNHRKILLIDDALAFCGGMNIGADYAGSFLGNNRFRDTCLRIEGPAVQDLADLFCKSLQETTGKKKKSSLPAAPFPKGVVAQVLGANKRRNLVAIQESMQVTLTQATRYCFFTTPYFLPYKKLKEAMLEAQQRKVDVRVLTAGLSDVPLMRLASQHVYGQFLQAGIRIYEMFGKTLHAKTATIDGIYGTVGSYNLDHWSARRNLEVNVSIWSPEIAQQLEAQFHDDLQLAKEISFADWKKRSIFKRIIQWFAYQIMRL